MGKKTGVVFRYEKKVPPYEEALYLVGLEPVRITPDSNGGLEGLQGLLLTGGTDVDPALFGEQRHEESDAPDTARDRAELALVREALDTGIPVLAICRGMQIFNVALGGTLIQHLPNSAQHRQPGVFAVHPVRIAEGSLLRSITGADSYVVNSRHHQAVAKVGEGLNVAAKSDDGVIEALEHPGHSFAVAVQWHPEDRISRDPHDRKLFEAFSKQVRKFQR
jgi:putative glutamine amidotransferase